MIKTLRTAKKLSQEQLANRAGLTKDYISRVERGVSTNLGVETIRKIAFALDVSPTAIFAHLEAQPSE